MALTASESALLAICGGSAEAVNGSDWEGLLKLAEIYEAAPLVAAQLWRRHSSLFRLSETAGQTLGHLHAQAVIQQGLLEGELAAVLAALSDVPTLVLKGLALARLYYRPGERLCRDIDLLVQEDDYARARNHLSELGYRVMDAYDEDLQRRMGKDVAFIRTDSQGKRWSVEVHWRLSEPGAARLDESGVWGTARQVPFPGGSFRCPSHHHSLLLLALNLRKHGFARLKTIFDIDRLVRSEGHSLDWEKLHDLAHEAGLCIALRHALTLTEALLSTPWGLAPCSKSRSLQGRLLARMAGPDAAMNEGRESSSYQAVAGLLPFVSLDSVGEILHLIYGRLSLSAELASYRAGSVGLYKSRRQYLMNTARRLVGAMENLVRADHGVLANHEPVIAVPANRSDRLKTGLDWDLQTVREHHLQEDNVAV